VHESCICQQGEPCFHESFVFSVGETARKVVELCIYQENGDLSRLSVHGYTSWKRSRNRDRISSKTPRGFDKAVLIDRITREEHCLTIDCFDIAFLFFGRRIVLRTEHVASVDRPCRFGDRPSAEYRKKYMQYFNRHSHRDEA